MKAVKGGMNKWLNDGTATAGGIGACIGTCVLASMHSGCVGSGSGGVGSRGGSGSIVGSLGGGRFVVWGRGRGIAGGVVESGGSVVHKGSGVVHGVDGSGVVDGMTVMILLPGVQVNLGDSDGVTGNQRVAERKKILHKIYK